MEPRYLISSTERKPSGGLATSHLQQIRGLILKGGMVMLPSDTGYSLAAIPSNAQVYQRINFILNRGNEPMSLAFPNFHTVEQFVQMNLVVANLLELFTPGPITVICKALDRAHGNDNFHSIVEQIINSTDGTVGVRIPDSLVEREISACTFYPITTVAVRDKSGGIVHDFDRAVEIVKSGMKKANFQNWAAIKGDSFASRHSTIIRVNYTTNQCEIIREGAIAKHELTNIENRLPSWAYEDWT